MVLELRKQSLKRKHYVAIQKLFRNRLIDTILTRVFIESTPLSLHIEYSGFIVRFGLFKHNFFWSIYTVTMIKIKIQMLLMLFRDSIKLLEI